MQEVYSWFHPIGRLMYWKIHLGGTLDRRQKFLRLSIWIGNNLHPIYYQWLNTVLEKQYEHISWRSWAGVFFLRHTSSGLPNSWVWPWLSCPSKFRVHQNKKIWWWHQKQTANLKFKYDFPVKNMNFYFSGIAKTPIFF